MSRKTPLFEKHRSLGGKIVDFAGWELPVQYSSAIEEHMAVREKAGLFDVSHMGEFELRGKESPVFLSRLIPTSLSRLGISSGMYSCLCNEKGGVIDDLFIFRKSSGMFYLVVNAATKDKDYNWISSRLDEGVIFEDVSDRTAKIDIQGPLSCEILKKLFPDSISREIESLDRFKFMETAYNGDALMISYTGYTGEQGYELFISPETAPLLWDSLMAAGEPLGLLPCGLAARDSLRLEACYSLYGHEISEDINPVEAGLSWIVNSEESYTGSEVLKKVKASGAPRKLYCLEVIDKGIPREGYPVEFNGEEIGYVTSGGYSPVKQKGIAMALLKTGAVKTGDSTDIIIRGKKVAAVVVKKPFYSFNKK